MSRKPVQFTERNAPHQLRAATAGLWADSPVVIRTRDGRRFRLETYEILQEQDEGGKPLSPPQMVITIVDCPPEPPTAAPGELQSTPAPGVEESTKSASGAAPAPTETFSKSPESFDGTFPAPARRARMIDRGPPNQGDGHA